jgi:hypothetical protein
MSEPSSDKPYNIRVSEKAIDNKYNAILKGSEVSIIPKQYAKLNSSDGGTYINDESNFLKGTLIEKEVLYDDDGRNANVIYTVQLNQLKFSSGDGKYYFKIEEPNEQPSSSTGGKKSRRKRNIKKSRKNRRKSSRRR